jgi:hypothetical protein
MRDDPNIPTLNSLAAMRHYARALWAMAAVSTLAVRQF